MKRSGFKRKATKPLRRTRIRVVGVSSTAEVKKEIQATLREYVIKRDGGCVLRDSKVGPCNKVLQAEHLVTRSNSASFADPRNVVCLCSYHHIFWKPKNSQLYWELIEGIIGPTRWELIKRLQKDYSNYVTYKVDMKLALVGLKQELKRL